MSPIFPSASSAQLVEAVLDVVRRQVLSEIQEQEEQSKPVSSKRLLTVAEAAEYMGRTENAMRQLIHKKLIPVVRFGRNIRIDIRDLEAIIAEYRV